MRKIPLVLLAIIAASSVATAQMNTLATLAIEGPLRALEKDYQQPGQSVKVTFDTSPNITKRRS